MISRRIPRRWLLPAAIGATAGFAAARAGAAPPRRIVAAGGSVTETVCALGAADRLVAVDSTSRFPERVGALPRIGYLRALATEGLIGLDADLMLLSDEAGPPQALAVLRAAGAPIRIVPDEPGAAGVARKIAAVASALGQEGGALADTFLVDWRALDAPIAALRPVRALFVLSVARGAPLVSGEGTHADAMLRAAGAVNVIRGFSGYRPLSAEAAAGLAPEAIVMMEHALAEGGGAEAVTRIPALAVTPAAAARRVVALDGSYMLGFSPRAAHARRDLAALLHPRTPLPGLPRRPWT
ncbi:MAG TPA: ABC transporter substrate-binding protein [Falsiroseomonas sp.]|jgi:iron complex transport system substrate-binding protein|nr:ABC transporter substrate-binding protein [Falsiroseomonas sp.]